MVQPQYSPQEALERVKLMMNYDTSKTLNENKEVISEKYHWLLPTGQVIAGTALRKGAIPAGAKMFTSRAAALAASRAAVTVAGTAGVAGAAGAGGIGSSIAALATNPIGWAIGGTIAASALAYWMYDSINNGMPTAAKVKSFFDGCSSQSKNLKQVKSNSEIVSAAEQINTAIEGISTDEDAIKSAILSMGNVADLCALRAKYDARYGNLYEDLDGDIDGTDWKTYVWAPMQNIIELSVEEIKPIVKTGSGGASKYKKCSGTYGINCMSDTITTVQSCVGLTPDGKFGPKTAAKLKGLGYTTFKDGDVETICGKINYTPVVSGEEPEVSGEDITINSNDANF